MATRRGLAVSARLGAEAGGVSQCGREFRFSGRTDLLLAMPRPLRVLGPILAVLLMGAVCDNMTDNEEGEGDPQTALLVGPYRGQVVAPLGTTNRTVTVDVFVDDLDRIESVGSGTFDARVSLTGANGTLTDQIQTRARIETRQTSVTLELDTNSGGTPYTFVIEGTGRIQSGGEQIVLTNATVRTVASDGTESEVTRTVTLVWIEPT